MGKQHLVICYVVSFLGVLAAATGFAAEGTRTKPSQVKFISATECEFPRSPALQLGFTSALSLLIAKIILNVASGCVCCQPVARQSANWAVIWTCFVVSWFLFIISFLLLVTGAALNDKHDQETNYYGSYSCVVVKPGAFTAAAILAFISIALGIKYYTSLASLKTQQSPHLSSIGPNGIAMGQPQFPPQTPVFVHEDTYQRRQFT